MKVKKHAKSFIALILLVAVSFSFLPISLSGLPAALATKIAPPREKTPPLEALIQYPPICELALPFYGAPAKTVALKKECELFANLQEAYLLLRAAAERIVEMTDPSGQANPFYNCKTSCGWRLTQEKIFEIFVALCLILEDLFKGADITGLFSWLMASGPVGALNTVSCAYERFRQENAANLMTDNARKKLAGDLADLGRYLNDIDLENLKIDDLIGEFDGIAMSTTLTQQKIFVVQENLNTIQDNILAIQDIFGTGLLASFELVLQEKEAEIASRIAVLNQNDKLLGHIGFLSAKKDFTRSMLIVIRDVLKDSSEISQGNKAKLDKIINETIPAISKDLSYLQNEGENLKSGEASMGIREGLVIVEDVKVRLQNIENSFDVISSGLALLDSEIQERYTSGDKSVVSDNIGQIKQAIEGAGGVKAKIQEILALVRNIEALFSAKTLQAFLVFDVLEEIRVAVEEPEAGLARLFQSAQAGNAENIGQTVDEIKSQIGGLRDKLATVKEIVLSLGIASEKFTTMEKAFNTAQAELDQELKTLLAGLNTQSHGLIELLYNAFKSYQALEDALFGPQKDVATRAETNKKQRTAEVPRACKETEKATALRSDTWGGEGGLGERTAIEYRIQKPDLDWIRTSPLPCQGYKGTNRVFPDFQAAYNLVAQQTSLISQGVGKMMAHAGIGIEIGEFLRGMFKKSPEFIMATKDSNDVESKTWQMLGKATTILTVSTFLKEISDKCTCGRSWCSFCEYSLQSADPRKFLSQDCGDREQIPFGISGMPFCHEVLWVFDKKGRPAEEANNPRYCLGAFVLRQALKAIIETPAEDTEVVLARSSDWQDCLSPDDIANIAQQQMDASPDLQALLDYIAQRVPPKDQSATYCQWWLTSISDSHGVESCVGDKWKPQCQLSDDPAKEGCCWHAKNSCHYGGTNPNCQGKSYAFDLQKPSNPAGLATVEEIKRVACQAGKELGKEVVVVDEGNHIHISINARACGCAADYSKNLCPGLIAYEKRLF